MPYKSSSSFKGPKKASILKSDVKGFVDVVSAYSPDYVDDLKMSIDPSYRRWDPLTKRWTVNEIVLDDLIKCLKRHFSEVTTDLVEPEPTIANIWEEIFRVVPKDYQAQVYHALSNAVHPDHGGSVDQMKALNSAYQKYKV